MPRRRLLLLGAALLAGCTAERRADAAGRTLPTCALRIRAADVAWPVRAVREPYPMRVALPRDAGEVLEEGTVVGFATPDSSLRLGIGVRARPSAGGIVAIGSPDGVQRRPVVEPSCRLRIDGRWSVATPAAMVAVARTSAPDTLFTLYADRPVGTDSLLSAIVVAATRSTRDTAVAALAAARLGALGER